MTRLALGVERVPERDRHAEEALPADQPVTVQAIHPVLVPDPHVGGVPADPAAGLDQGPRQFRVAPAVAQVPLPGGDDLQRLAAPLVEVDRVPDRLRVGEQVAVGAQQSGDPFPGGHRGLTGELPVGVAARPAGDRRGRAGHEAAVPAHHRPGLQVQLPPPGDVVGVAERAHHGDPGALRRVGQMVRPHRHLHPEHRRAHGRADQGGIALVPRVGDQRHAGGRAARAGWSRPAPPRRPGCGRRSGSRPRPPPGPPARPGRPRCRRSHPTGSAPPPGTPRRAPGCAGRRAARWRGSGSSMVRYIVDQSTDSPSRRHTSSNACSSRSVRRCAQLHEVAPRHRDLLGARAGRRHERRVVGQRGVAPDVEVVLHPALGRQAVVVPPDRVEHLLAAHALEPRDRVGVGERADVPDMQLPADRQRRGVDGEDIATRGGAVKRVLHPTLPTCATTSPRCRQARACPARGWPGAPAARGWGGNRCS